VKVFHILIEKKVEYVSNALVKALGPFFRLRFFNNGGKAAGLLAAAFFSL
jgi:hypothetical protein